MFSFEKSAPSSKIDDLKVTTQINRLKIQFQAEKIEKLEKSVGEGESSEDEIEEKIQEKPNLREV